MAAQAQEGLDELLNVQVRRFDGEEIPLLQSKALCWGIREEIPHVQGKEQRLHFAGAAVKRYPMLKVRETQIRL